jgi:hypothetical protein
MAAKKGASLKTKLWVIALWALSGVVLYRERSYELDTIKAQVLWVLFSLFILVSAYRYRNREGQKRIDDDSDDPWRFFFASFWQGPFWQVSELFKIGAKYWPTQIIAFVFVWLTQATIGPLLGLESRFFLATMTWAWFTWVSHRYLADLLAPLTRRRDSKSDAVEFNEKVGKLPKKALDRIEYGKNQGDARIPVKAFIPEEDRQRAAAHLAGLVKGARSHEILYDHDTQEMTVVTKGGFVDESERVAAKINDKKGFGEPVKGVGEGPNGAVDISCMTPRTTEKRRETADRLLAIAEGFIYRDDYKTDGDWITVRLHQTYPNESARILDQHVKPELPKKDIIAVVQDGWGACFDARCEPSKKARYELAHKIRAAIPGATIIGEIEPLTEGDWVRFKYLPTELTEQQINQKLWDDITVAAAFRQPQDPPLIASLLERDNEDRLTKVVFRREPDENEKRLRDGAAWIAFELDATSHRMAQLPDSSDVEMLFAYNQPARLINAHPEDVPLDVEPEDLPPRETWATFDPELLKSTNGLLLGILRWEEPAYMDYMNSAYQIGLFGMSGMGKGLMAMNMLIHCILMGHDITVVSPKVGEYKWAEAYGVRVVDVNEVKEINKLLKEQYELNQEREALNTLHEVGNWTILRKRAKAMRQRHIDEHGHPEKYDLFYKMGGDSGQDARKILIFDELKASFGAARLESEKAVQELDARLSILLSVARSTEINLIVMTQSTLAKDMGGSTSIRDGLIGRIWMGRDVGIKGGQAMDLGENETHPTVTAASAHSTGTFMARFTEDGPLSNEILVGRTPFISPTYALYLVWKLGDGKIKGVAAKQRLRRIKDQGELPEWMEPLFEEMPDPETRPEDLTDEKLLELGARYEDDPNGEGQVLVYDDEQPDDIGN